MVILFVASLILTKQMAESSVSLIRGRGRSPLITVKNFFDAVEEHFKACDEKTESSHKLRERSEDMARCMLYQMEEQHKASETTVEVCGVFRVALNKLVQLRNEHNSLKSMVTELRMADHGIDARPLELPASKSHRPGLPSPGGSISRAVSYEDFKKQRDLQLSSRSLVGSDASSMRRARSEGDVAIQSLKKKAEALTIDNSRLRESEKRLLKENVQLTRTCKTLEEQRDRAEERLVIEQTQRDSIEKLRQRNKQLEDQLKVLCETYVIKERNQKIPSTDNTEP